MAKKKISKKTVDESQSSIPEQTTDEDRLTTLMRHYMWGVQDMDVRRTRKNGWNEVINAYMGKLPPNWPYNAVVTNPLVRTTILEKTGRLLNSKLQGRLIPREGGDMAKAKINNALLDFQWDFATEGGSMVEKIAMVDQFTRIFGAGFVLTYWDAKRNTNEIKVLDPRDMFFDGGASHIRNCKWVQVREFTTLDKLEQRGYDVSQAREMAERGEITAELKSTRYESIVKANRGLMDRTGQIDDLQNPVVEVVSEWGFDKDQAPYCTIFLPKYALVISDGPSPYKHGKLPVSMLRYYPLVDDIYGESEIEPVMSLQRAIWAMTCGFIDEANIKMRPPLKINSTGVRIETIEYGPGAKWIMNSPDNVMEMEPGGGFISTFQAVYPMLLAAFNTAMGDQSLSTNSGAGTAPISDNPTATQVITAEKQQNTRDQYNQLYLAEFLKDIMLQWLANNKQYLFDDPTKKYQILKIIGKDMIKEFQQMRMDDKDVPDWAMKQIRDAVMAHPGAVDQQKLQDLMGDIAQPVHPVITNPNETDPDKYEVKPKLDIDENGKVADLYITSDDFEGDYDYVPDVKSMAAGAGVMAQQARSMILQEALSPEVQQMLQTQGYMLKIKDVLTDSFEDAGYRDAESLFEPVQEQKNDQPTDIPKININFRDLPPDGQVQAAAEAGIKLDPGGLQQQQQALQAQSSSMPAQAAGAGGMGVPQGVPNQAVNGGLPQA